MMRFSALLLCLVLVIVPRLSLAETWVYGDCETVIDGFYSCHDLDGDVVYTNVTPDPEMQARFDKLKRPMQKLKHLGQQQDEIKRRLQSLSRKRVHHR